PRYPSSQEDLRNQLRDSEPLVDTEPLDTDPLLEHLSPTPSPLPRPVPSTDLRVSESPEPTQPTSPLHRPPNVRRTEHLPRASAFVYAPAHTIIQTQHEARFPYDFEQMSVSLLAQSTPPTQPDSDIEATAETALSSDFSQTFLSPAHVFEPVVQSRVVVPEQMSRVALEPEKSRAASESEQSRVATESSQSRPLPCRTPLKPPTPAIRPLHFRHSTPLTMLSSTRPSSRSSDDRQWSPMADEFPDDLITSGRRRRSSHITPSPSLRRPASANHIRNLSAQSPSPSKHIPIDPPSSPVLPQPQLLLQPRPSQDVDKKSIYDELFDPCVDPPSSLDSPPTTEPSPVKQVLAEPPRVKQEPIEPHVKHVSIEPSPVKQVSIEPPHVKSVSADSVGWINVDEKPKRTPVGGTRSKSLRESLRRLPGNRGPVRTGLSSRRKLHTRTPIVRSHRNLDLGQNSVTGSDVTVPVTPVSRQRSADTSVMSPPLTRQRSNSGIGTIDNKSTSKGTNKSTSKGTNKTLGAETNDAPTLVMLSGVPCAEKTEITRILSQQSLEITENPLVATVCIRHGRLGRTLKVLCALARGVPIVPVSWAHTLDASLVLSDRTTERDWGITLADTLRRARISPILRAFSVIIASVTRDPVCLAVIVRAAGGCVLNDFGGLQDQLLLGNPGVPSPSPFAPMEPTVAALLGAESQSSSEPDNDSDEDWSIEQTRPRTRGSRRKRRKTLPRLKPANIDECSLESEASVILAPPTAPHTPTTVGVRKRRRTTQPVLDPACSPAGLQAMIDARRTELDVDASAQLLVVTDEPGTEWTKHCAKVVTPELVIQSIIHCALQF
ncbi:Mediator of DNA damage checkpoint protein 1, partial [Coemansia sp. RSA 678]